MMLFSFMGFVGFLYFYVFFKENIRFKHYLWGYDLLTLTFFFTQPAFLVLVPWKRFYYFHGDRTVFLWRK